MIKKAFFIQMVVSVLASAALSQTGIVDKIRSMEGEWIIISDAATTVPQTNYLFLVQNDVCGKMTVVCTQSMEDKKNHGPSEIWTIVFRYGNTVGSFEHPRALMYPAEKDGEPSPYYVGSYDTTNNCIEWNKPTGDEKRCRRWRFSEDNMFFTREGWDSLLGEWRVGGTLLCRKSVVGEAQRAAAKHLNGGYRDRYGNLVWESTQGEPVNKDYRLQIKHVPDAIFAGDSCYTVNASYGGNQVVTQAIVEAVVHTWLGDKERYNMSCNLRTNFVASIPMTSFYSYSIVFYCDDGSTNRTRWILPFRYRNFTRVDFNNNQKLNIERMAQ
jgi:hypothetical protein